MKKITQIWIVVFVLGTSIVTPANVLFETPVKAASVSSKVATDAILALFANNNPSSNILKLTTGQQAIDGAQQLTDVATDITDTVRANMQASIEQAKDLLKLRNTTADYSLFAEDADITSVAITGINGKGITSVRLLIDGVGKATGTLKTDGTYSIPTNNFITQGSKVEVAGYNGTNEVARITGEVSNNEKPLVLGANEALAKTMAAKAVSALFQDDRSSTNTLKLTTAQKTIDFAQNMINVVLDAVVKATMQKELDKAQGLLDARNKQAIDDQAQKVAASDTVNKLFVNNTSASDAIKASTDQAAIDNVQTEIDKIQDSAMRVDLQKDLNRAQELLDAKNAVVAAEKAVNELFNNNTPASGVIKPNTDQATIDAALVVVNTVTEPITKAVLQADIDKAQQLLNSRNTVLAVLKLNAMTENDDTITGKAAPNAKVRYVVGGQPVNVGYADVNGNYTMYIGKQKVGTVVGVEVFDPATNKYKAAVTTTIIAVNVTIQAMTNTNDTVTGTAPANAKLRFLVKGVAVNVGTADASGNYSKYIGTQIVGTAVAVEMLNPDTGKYELAKSITVTGAPKSINYTVGALTTEDDTLKGTAPANAKLRFSIDGNLISVITADASGNYSKYIGKQKAGVDVSVELLNENTNQYTAPQAVTVTVGTSNAALVPVIHTITEGQGVVTGTVPTSVTTVRVWVNGNAQTMVAATNGNFTWTKANLKAGDTVKVDYKDASGAWISAEKVVTK